MEKIVIFGGTGRTGVCALEAAVRTGLKVRAFVRNASKVPENLKDKVEIFLGNVLEPDSVKNAVDGTDGVVIVLGTNDRLEPTTDMSEGTKNIIEAMKAKNVKRLSACMSAYIWYKPERIPKRFLNINDDHRRMYKAIKESGLDWIAVLPAHITDEPSRDIIVHINPNETPGRLISKWDLGAFLVNSLKQQKYYKSTIGIANVPK